MGACTRMKRLKALIFDVDGTLANTEETHRLAFNEAFTQHGLDWHWSESVYADLLKTTGGKERIAAYLSTLALTAADRDRHAAIIPDLHRSKTAIYTRRVKAGEVALRDGVVRLLDEAQSADVQLAIATTTSFDNIAVLLESSIGPFSLKRFAAIGAGDQVKRKKPAPDVYESVLKQLGLPPEACVAFEDSRNGLVSAKAAGLFTVVTPSYWTLNEDFSGADLLLSTLGSAAAPLPASEAHRVGSSVLGIAQIEHHLASSSFSP